MGLGQPPTPEDYTIQNNIGIVWDFVGNESEYTDCMPAWRIITEINVSDSFMSVSNKGFSFLFSWVLLSTVQTFVKLDYSWDNNLKSDYTEVMNQFCNKLDFYSDIALSEDRL